MSFVLLLGHAPGDEARRLEAAGIPWRHLRLLDHAPTGAPPPEGGPPQHLIVTSARTFESVSADELAELFAPARLHVVGERTAAAARAVGLRPETVGVARGVEVVAEVRRRAAPGERIWLAGAEVLAGATARALGASGPAAPIEHWPVYGHVATPGSAEAVRALPVAALVAVGSPAQIRRFAEAGGRAEAAVAIGPTTAAAVEALGLPLVGALSDRFSRDRLGQLAVRCWRELSRAGPG